MYALILLLLVSQSLAVHLENEQQLTIHLKGSYWSALITRLLTLFDHQSITQLLSQLDSNLCVQRLLDSSQSATDLIRRSAVCQLGNGLCNIEEDDSEILALKMFDSWARPNSGLLSSGQFLWFGDYEQCVNMENTHYCQLKTSSLEKLIQNKHLPVVQIGLCLPVECHTELVQKLIGTLVRYTYNRSKVVAPLLKQNIQVSCSDDWSFWNGRVVGKVLMCCVVIILILLVIIGTIADYVRINVLKERSSRQKLARSTASSSGLGVASQLTYKSVPAIKETFCQRRLWLRILVAFSARLNLKWIYRGNQRKVKKDGHIAALYGLRCLMMIWVITGHTYLFALPFVSNLASAAHTIRSGFFSQLLLNSSLAVDSFFMMSGLLTTYVWARKLNRSEHLCSLWRWALFYFHRLVRLLPAYIVLVGFVYSVFPYMADGPAWNPQSIFGAQCNGSDWWKHLMLISNYWPSNCLPWMWYLSLDSQFYLVAPFLLCLFSLNEIWAVRTILAISFSSALIRGVITTENLYPPNLMLMMPQENFNSSAVREMFQNIYAMPYTRIGPFLIGMLFGWFLCQKGAHCYISTRKSVFLWILSLSVTKWCIFGAYPLYLGFQSHLYTFLFSGFVRTAWAASWALKIFLCHTQNGGPLGYLMSWMCWRPMARLSYCAYLCHELILIAYFYSMRKPIYFQGHFEMGLKVIGVVFVSYFIALILCVIVECPPLALERLLLKRRPKKLKRRTTLPRVCPAERTKIWVQEPEAKLSKMPIIEDDEVTISTGITSHSNISNKTQDSTGASQMDDLDSITSITTANVESPFTSSKYYNSEMECDTCSEIIKSDTTPKSDQITN